MKTDKFQALKLIFAEGDHGEQAYRVIEGSVEISIQRDGQKLILAILGAGETFGEMAMIESRPRSATARALEPTTIEVIERQDFQQILDEGGEQLVPYLTMIFDRLRVTNDRLLIALDKLNELQPAVKHRHQGIFGSRRTAVQVLIEPDSEEIHQQTALKKRLLRFFPFHFCRRAQTTGTKAILQNQIKSLRKGRKREPSGTEILGARTMSSTPNTNCSAGPAAVTTNNCLRSSLPAGKEA